MNVLFLLIHPRAVREAASERSELASIFLNGVNGVLVMIALSISMQSLFTPTLIVLLAILFGPLAGFTVSSLYSRLEWAVGRRLGGKASLDELYRLFAWSSFPAAVAVLLYGLILAPLTNPSPLTQIIAAIPSVAILCCGVRNYCSNLIAVQQFTIKRGIACNFLTLVLFLALVAGGISYLWLFFEYGAGEGVKTMFNW